MPVKKEYLTAAEMKENEERMRRYHSDMRDFSNDEQRQNITVAVIITVVVMLFIGWIVVGIIQDNHKSQFQKCNEYQDRTGDISKDCTDLLPSR